jgi:uncharacterized protein YjbI with pentapeptide repeats
MDELDSESYEGQALSGLDLRGAVLSGKEFVSCRIEHCDFTEADLSRSVFEDCRFVSCNFSNPVIRGSRLAGSAFEECKLVGLNFGACDQLVFDAEFLGCRLSSCNFSELKMKGAKIKDCRLEACYFQNAYLAGAAFDGSQFDGVLFHECDLTRSSFRKASGYSIDPRINKVEKAVFCLPDALGLLGCFGIKLESPGED